MFSDGSDCYCDDCPYNSICSYDCSQCSEREFCTRSGSTEGVSPLS